MNNLATYKNTPTTSTSTIHSQQIHHHPSHHTKVSPHLTTPYQTANPTMPIPTPLVLHLLKGVKLAAKGTAFAAVVAAINVAPVAACQRFGPWSQEKLERGIRDQRPW